MPHALQLRDSQMDLDDGQLVRNASHTVDTAKQQLAIAKERAEALELQVAAAEKKVQVSVFAQLSYSLRAIVSCFHFWATECALCVFGICFSCNLKQLVSFASEPRARNIGSRDQGNTSRGAGGDTRNHVVCSGAEARG